MRPLSHRRRFVNKILTLFKKTHDDENAKYPSELLAKYKISEKTLGVGSFAVVKQCTDINSKEECAVKIILKKVIAGKRQMLDSEIDILKHVRHPHIVSMRDIYESEDAVYIVTDLCTGGELFQRIVERGTYTESIASDLVRQMLEGLSYLHSQDIVHRDMKPENLLFKTPAENSDLLITDFGLAKLLKNNNQVLTTACGTPGYVAPEVLKGVGHGKPVDLWSIGVIMYTLLSGYTPFYGEDQNQLFDAIIRGDYQFDEEYWSEISIEAKDLINKLLTLDPKKRITADEALQDPWIKGISNKGINLADNVRKGLHNHRDLKTLVTVISFVKKLKMVDHLVTDAETDTAHSEIVSEDESKILFNNNSTQNNTTPELKTADNKAQCDTEEQPKTIANKAPPSMADSSSIVTETRDGEKNGTNENGLAINLDANNDGPTATETVHNSFVNNVTDNSSNISTQPTGEAIAVETTPIDKVSAASPIMTSTVDMNSESIKSNTTSILNDPATIDKRVNPEDETVTTISNEQPQQKIIEEKNIENAIYDGVKGNIGNTLENEMKNVRISR